MTKNNSKTPARTLATVSTAFKRAIGSEETARMTAATLAFEYVVTLKGQAKGLAEKANVSESTVSKALLAGKALALAPDQDDETKRAIVRTAHGMGGDRKALVAAVKDKSPAGVVTAAKAEAPSKGSGKKDGKKNGGKKDEATRLEDMTTEALIALVGQVFELVALRDDLPEQAVALTKVTKAGALIAKSGMSMTVA